MAQVVSITIGGKGEIPVTSAAYGFPVQSILLKPAQANTKFNNVVMLTEIVYQQNRVTSKSCQLLLSNCTSYNHNLL